MYHLQRMKTDGVWLNKLFITSTQNIMSWRTWKSRNSFYFFNTDIVVFNTVEKQIHVITVTVIRKSGMTEVDGTIWSETTLGSHLCLNGGLKQASLSHVRLLLKDNSFHLRLKSPPNNRCMTNTSEKMDWSFLMSFSAKTIICQWKLTGCWVSNPMNIWLCYFAGSGPNSRDSLNFFRFLYAKKSQYLKDLKTVKMLHRQAMDK